MAGVPLKFRCFQCNQLLGVSRSKVGTVVACPKCATNLIVPEPDESPASSGVIASMESTEVSSPETLMDTSPAFLSDLDSGIPLELSDIRPEDIRVQLDNGWTPVVTTPPTPAAPAPAVPIVPATWIPEARDAVSPGVAPAFRAAAPPNSNPPPPSAPIVPEIRLEPPTLMQERMPMARSRDLVLPRSVVATWSLFVLLAQALAFIAGLLAGHFVWRIH